MDVFVGQTGVTRVKLFDTAGRPGATYDEAGGIAWSNTHADSMQVVDEDADPKDARITFGPMPTPLGEDAFVEVSLDARQGPDENRLTFRSPPLHVLEPPPGEAVGGEVEIVLDMVAPPA